MSFLLAILLARGLGPDGFGVLNFALAWSAVLTMVADGGLTLYVGKLVAASGAHWEAAYARAFRLKVILLAVILPPFVLASWILPSVRDHARILLLVLAGETLRSISVFICFAFRGLRRAYLEPLVLGLDRVLLLMTGFGALRSGGGLEAVALAYAGCRIVSLGAGLALARGLGATRGAGPFTLVAAHADLRKSFPLGIFLLCDRLIIQGATILLMSWSTAAATGVFQAAYKIVMVPAMVSAAFCGSLIGPLVVARGAGPRRFLALVRAGLAIGSHLMFAFSLAVLLWGDRLVQALYGSSYAPAGPVLRILVLHFAGFGLYHTAVFTLMAVNEEAFVGRSMAACAILSLAATTAGAAWGGAAGAGWALGATSLLINTVFARRLWRHGVRWPGAGLAAPAVVILALVAWPGAGSPAALAGVPVLVLLPATMAAYAVLVWTVGLAAGDRAALSTLASSLRLRRA